MATGDNTVASVSLRCLKCSEDYINPRLLPCTHTFCEECLISHIDSVGSTGNDHLTRFNCPLCRHSIEAPRPRLSPSDIAKSFPLNTLYRSLTETKDSDVTLCNVCLSDNNERKAFVWCENCWETLCTQCHDAHKKARPTRGHELVILSDTDPRKLAYSFPPAECAHHPEEPIDSFCKNHGELCCSVCPPTRHSDCTPILSLDDIATRIEHNNDKASYLHEFENIASDIKRISQREEANINNVSVDYTDIVKSVDSLITKAKERLDDLHNDFKRIAKAQQEKRNSKMKNTLDQTRRLQTLVENCVCVLSAVTNRASPRQVFVVQELMKAQLTPHIREVRDSIKDYKELQLELEIEDEVSNIVKATAPVGYILEKELPSVDFQDALARIEENIEILRKKPDPSMLDDLVSSPSSDTGTLSDDTDRIACTTRKLKSVRLEGERWLTGATYLPDDRLLMSDFNNRKIIMCDDRYNIVSEQQLDTKPSDIAYSVKHQQVLVRTISQVVKYNISGRKLEKAGELQLEPCDHMCGIAVCENTVFAGKDGSIQLLEMDGASQKDISKSGKCTYVAVCGDLKRLCYPDDGEIVCCSLDGTTLFRHRDGNLESIKGLSFDRTGHIYVCCLTNPVGRVYQISPDGKRGRDLVLEESNIRQPYSIACHPSRDVFVVTSKEESVTFEVFALK